MKLEIGISYAQVNFVYYFTKKKKNKKINGQKTKKKKGNDENRCENFALFLFWLLSLAEDLLLLLLFNVRAFCILGQIFNLKRKLQLPLFRVSAQFSSHMQI